MDVQKLVFENWTEYDNWLIQNYAGNAIFKVDEIEGKIHIEYCSKEDFAKMNKN